MCSFPDNFLIPTESLANMYAVMYTIFIFKDPQPTFNSEVFKTIKPQFSEGSSCQAANIKREALY